MMIPFKNEKTNSETGSSTNSWLYLSFYFEYVIGLGIISFSIILNVITLLLPKPPRSLTGNVVLIAGASSTLGEELAEEFAGNGCSVICVDNDLRSMEEMTARLRSRRVEGIGPDHRHGSENGELSTIVTYKCDLMDRRAIRQVARKIEEEIGGIDVLVNCVGQSESDIFDVTTMTFMSHYLTMMTFMPFLRSDNACIVEILPVAIVDNMYLSSRTVALVNLMEYLSKELNNFFGHFTFLNMTRTAKHQSLIRQTEQQFALDVVQAVRGNYCADNWWSKILYQISYMIYNAITTFTQWLYTQEYDYFL